MGMQEGAPAGPRAAKTIFIVEDDAALRSELVRLLRLQGLEARCCGSFERAAEEVRAARPDCVVLDLRLPGADGLQICRDIRAAGDTPVIVLTSSESEFDEVMAFNLGADDYVVKPYRPATLLARIESILRRSDAVAPLVLEHAGLALDVAAGTVSFNGRTAELSRNEQRILQLLLRDAGAVVSRQQMMASLWESDEFIDDNTLTVNVNRLRRVLASIGAPEDYVKTRRGMGYSV